MIRFATAQLSPLLRKNSSAGVSDCAILFRNGGGALADRAKFRRCHGLSPELAWSNANVSVKSVGCAPVIRQYKKGGVIHNSFTAIHGFQAMHKTVGVARPVPVLPSPTLLTNPIQPKSFVTLAAISPISLPPLDPAEQKMKTVRRTLLSMIPLLITVSHAHAQNSVEICEIHPAYCSPATKAYRAGPQAVCPENMVTCSSTMPAASLFCDAGLCQAFPEAYDNSLSYQWGSSNAYVTITPFGSQLFYSCSQNQSVMIDVVVSDAYGNQRSAQQLVYCRRQSGGGNQPQ